jgi:hypothetical protein
MTHKPFDLEKAMRNGGRCQTREGAPMVVIFTKLPCAYPLAVYCEDDPAIVRSYAECGREQIGRDRTNDLVNIPEKRTGWVVLIPQPKNIWLPIGPVYETKEEAQKDISYTVYRIVQLSEWEAD